MQPPIVLVHGAFAAADPLRGVASDAAAVSDLVRTIDGPVVLVGHSYGGAVISNVDPRARAHRTVEIPGASHAVPVAHAEATALLIREAATAQVVA